MATPLSGSTITKTEPFDIAIVDFPDPNNFALGKLYTTRFYNLLKQKLRPDSAVVIQTTSPLIARKSFWSVMKTLEASRLYCEAVSDKRPKFRHLGFRPGPPSTI